jgi:hypothetical protein
VIGCYLNWSSAPTSSGKGTWIEAGTSDVKRHPYRLQRMPVIACYLSAGMRLRPEGPGTYHRAPLPSKEAGKWVLFNWGQFPLAPFC